MGEDTMFATPAGDIPFFLKDLSCQPLPSLLVCPCVWYVLLSVLSLFVEKSGECGSELEESRRRCWGEKRGLGLSGPLGCLLKSGSGSVVYSSFVGLSSGHLAQVNLRRLHPYAL